METTFCPHDECQKEIYCWFVEINEKCPACGKKIETEKTEAA